MNNSCVKIAFANSQLMVRDSISRMLSDDACFEVCINVANGRELIHSFSGMNGLPDICVLDVQMPQMNGYETMNHIREYWPGLKVIVLTQLEDEFVIKSMLGLGVRSYLGKECTMRELRNAISSVNESGYYQSPLMARYTDVQANKPVCIDEQEYAYLKYCHTELTASEIAGAMNVTPGTVNNYRNSLFEKLKVRTRQGLAVFALKTGIIAPGDINIVRRQQHYPSV